MAIASITVALTAGVLSGSMDNAASSVDVSSSSLRYIIDAESSITSSSAGTLRIAEDYNEFVVTEPGGQFREDTFAEIAPGFGDMSPDPGAVPQPSSGSVFAERSIIDVYLSLGEDVG